jgi:hypothetical protein
MMTLQQGRWGKAAAAGFVMAVSALHRHAPHGWQMVLSQVATLNGKSFHPEGLFSVVSCIRETPSQAYGAAVWQRQPDEQRRKQTSQQASKQAELANPLDDTVTCPCS